MLFLEAVLLIVFIVTQISWLSCAYVFIIPSSLLYTIFHYHFSHFIFQRKNEHFSFLL